MTCKRHFAAIRSGQSLQQAFILVIVNAYSTVVYLLPRDVPFLHHARLDDVRLQVLEDKSVRLVHHACVK